MDPSGPVIPRATIHVTIEERSAKKMPVSLSRSTCVRKHGCAVRDSLETTDLYLERLIRIRIGPKAPRNRIGASLPVATLEAVHFHTNAVQTGANHNGRIACTRSNGFPDLTTMRVVLSLWSNSGNNVLLP